jgi:hypothetical protein
MRQFLWQAVDVSVSGCFDNCVCILVICVLAFTVFFYCFVCAYLFLFITGVSITVAE